MKINQIIREKRKEQSLTQEQVADYLGVSTPAVNKWEKGSSYPDITILPALARLLKVDLNTLLSFNEELSDEEIGHFSNHIVTIIQEKGFDIGFSEARAKIQEYPTCDKLIYMTALTLEGALIMFPPQEDKSYKNEVEKLYERVAHSEDEEIRSQANAMLISRYMEREEFDKAQSLIDTLPNRSVDKVQKQAQLYAQQEKLIEASKLLEGKLMKMAGELQATLMFMMEIALKEGKEDRAEHLAETAAQTAKLYDLWDYNLYSAHFQLAISKQDADECIKYLELILATAKSKWDIKNSMLYQHIGQKKGDESFTGYMISVLLTEIENDDSCTFLKADSRFLEIVNQYNS